MVHRRHMGTEAQAKLRLYVGESRRQGSCSFGRGAAMHRASEQAPVIWPRSYYASSIGTESFASLAPPRREEASPSSPPRHSLCTPRQTPADIHPRRDFCYRSSSVSPASYTLHRLTETFCYMFSLHYALHAQNLTASAHSVPEIRRFVNYRTRFL